MIDEEKTFTEFGYTSNSLSHGSNKKVYAICDDCGKERLVIFQSYKDLCKSCVKKGKNNSFYGKHHTEETKQKIRNNLNVSGKNNPFYGKSHTKESKKLMSETHKGVKMPSISGDKHPHWNPDLTEEDRNNKRKYPEYYEWVKLIFERDNYVCQICNKGGTLNAHHLEGYNNNPELRVELTNGITLCEECHKDFHHQYDYGNNTKEQFKKFKGDKL